MLFVAVCVFIWWALCARERRSRGPVDGAMRRPTNGSDVGVVADVSLSCAERAEWSALQVRAETDGDDRTASYRAWRPGGWLVRFPQLARSGWFGPLLAVTGLGMALSMVTVAVWVGAAAGLGLFVAGVAMTVMVVQAKQNDADTAGFISAWRRFRSDHTAS
ncbi:MAG: hypothetical protein ACR2MN_03845 [Acidimicrobiales bacterium]